MNETPAKILVVEDDRKLLSFLSRAMSEEGMVVDVARTGAEAIRQITSIRYALVVLDWMLPEGDGLNVCREVRRVGNNVPILMLTARGEVGEKVTALDAGADDYVTKPFHLEELLARTRALLRRNNGRNDGILTGGPVMLDLKERKASVAGNRIELTSREFSLLALLMRNAGRVVTRAEILASIWDIRSDPGSNVIDVHVRNVREKLGNAASMVETVRGQGYRFVIEPAP